MEGSSNLWCFLMEFYEVLCLWYLIRWAQEIIPSSVGEKFAIDFPGKVYGGSAGGFRTGGLSWVARTKTKAIILLPELVDFGSWELPRDTVYRYL